MPHELTDWVPLEPEEHARQEAAIVALVGAARLGTRSDRPWFLDIGSGDGRIAHPAAGAGACVVAVDIDEAAIARCVGPHITPRRLDALRASDEELRPPPPAPLYAGAWCLGHTFMLFHDVHGVAAFMRRLRRVVAPEGWFAIDAFQKPVWRDVSEGLWQTGVSEDGQWQLIWTPGSGDDTIVVRRGRAVRPRSWDIRPDDTVLRLWSMGELALLAEASGWSAPAEVPGGALLLFRNAPR